jgi:hypothetical protein
MPDRFSVLYEEVDADVRFNLSLHLLWVSLLLLSGCSGPAFLAC